MRSQTGPGSSTSARCATPRSCCPPSAPRSAPGARSPGTSATARCSSCSTTSSRSSTPPPTSPAWSPPVPGSSCSERAARRCVSPPSASTRSEPLPESPAVELFRQRAARQRRDPLRAGGRDLRARRPAAARDRARRGAGAGLRAGGAARAPGAASAAALLARPATCPSASARCTRPSAGAAELLDGGRAAAFPAVRGLRGRGDARGRGERSAMPTSTCSSRSSTRACCGGVRERLRDARDHPRVRRRAARRERRGRCGSPAPRRVLRRARGDVRVVGGDHPARRRAAPRPCTCRGGQPPRRDRVCARHRAHRACGPPCDEARELLGHAGRGRGPAARVGHPRARGRAAAGAARPRASHARVVGNRDGRPARHPRGVRALAWALPGTRRRVRHRVDGAPCRRAQPAHAWPGGRAGPRRGVARPPSQVRLEERRGAGEQPHCRPRMARRQP